MLAPDQRALYLEALQPPEGYQFDRGVGTTFTLDLLTLLIAPMSLALHEVSRAHEGLQDPILLLDSMQRFADRLTLFTQAGYIAIPDHNQYLYSYLENMVVEVQAPNGGTFHPKVWLLRYTSEVDAPVYRFLCLSRNLTFSRSWDVIVRLDGMLADRTNAFSRNHPLGDFIQALPDFAVHKVSKRVNDDVALLQDEVRKVDFKVPPPFEQDSLSFHPFGHRNHHPFDFGKYIQRTLAISPFLSEPILKSVTGSGEGHVLLSEPESLSMIGSEALARFENVFVFNDAAVDVPVDEEQGGEILEDEENETMHSPARLHAKLIVLERGWDATWYIGSANATTPAWNSKNVEFMLGMTGKKSKVGVDKILGDPEDELSLRTLLASFEPEEAVEITKDLALERYLESIRSWIANLGLRAKVVERDEDHYDFHLSTRKKPSQFPKGEISLRIWPIGLPESHAMKVPLGSLRDGITFSDLSMLALSSFIAFEVHADHASLSGEIRFVLNVPVTGMPEQRDGWIIRAVLSDPVQFLRYLRLILAEGVSWISPAWLTVDAKEGAGDIWRRIGDMEVPLLEDLVRAFSRSPEKIERIDEIIRRMEASGGTEEILSEEFRLLWEAIQTARKGAA